MQIGIGLPNTLDIAGPAVAEWARRAEQRGFSTLATIDRIVYPTFDSLTTLAVAAGATERIGLFPDILLAPIYNPIWLAKATASLHAMSGERLTLGLGVGGRPDDFAAMQRDFDGRGRLMDETLDVLARGWRGESLVPANVTGGEVAIAPQPPSSRVPILIGGNGKAALRRTVQYADGWTAGGGGPAAAGQMVQQVLAAWKEAGRSGQPRLAALVYFGLGDEDVSRASLQNYYGFLTDYVGFIVEGALRTPQAITDAVKAFEDVGITELIFDPTVPDLDEIDRLADLVL
ncbi:MAG TPA: LLM class flavin-dependent oxidoreductase [Frankiaceae bacterium]|nr:LLM class flavin-dependent oxidoreductase [Frankiaceae bacterium]